MLLCTGLGAAQSPPLSECASLLPRMHPTPDPYPAAIRLNTHNQALEGRRLQLAPQGDAEVEGIPGVLQQLQGEHREAIAGAKQLARQKQGQVASAPFKPPPDRPERLQPQVPPLCLFFSMGRTNSTD